MERSVFLKSFRESPIIGILRGYDLELCDLIAAAFQRAGLRYLEVTLNTQNVDKIIPHLRKKYQNLMIGAGTVCSDSDLACALEAGAAYIVTPALKPSIINTCVAKGVPVFSGALSPAEVYQAWMQGSTAVKVFPAGLMEPNYIKRLKATMQEVALLPTGGVTIQNMDAYLAAGAVGLGMGSTLFPDEYVRKADWQGLEEHFKLIQEKATSYL